MNDMDELSVQYIKLRQQREVLAQQFKDADAVIEKDMAEIDRLRTVTPMRRRLATNRASARLPVSNRRSSRPV